MSIKIQPLRNTSDHVYLKEAFSKFGQFTFQSKVLPTQSDEILITFSTQEQANLAYSSLNGATLSNFRLCLELLPSPNPPNQIPDIEIAIPSKPIHFLATPTPELTPTGSSHSPFFPEISQGSIDSHRSSPMPSDIPRTESPISVSGLPAEKNFLKNANEEGKNEIVPLVVVLPAKRQFETVSLVIPSQKEKCEVVFCEVCQKSIKKKSLKAHNGSKIHQSNLKMN